MASKRRIRRNQCGSKKRYPDERAARRGIAILAHSAGPIGYMNTYHCPHCGQWYIGHARKA